MPEGPTLLILAETLAPFVGKAVREVDGSTRADLSGVAGRRLLAMRTWGKHLLMCFPGVVLRVHLLLFGSCRIDDDAPGRRPTLRLVFARGVVSFYASSVKRIDGPLDAVYDWSADVLSEAWDARAALKKLRSGPDRWICDALLDQEIFAGVGNIIKNEVLFLLGLHPLRRVGELETRQQRALVREARRYSFRFLEWKRRGVLRAHWQAHRRSTCPHCTLPLAKERLGVTRRWCHFCPRCQPAPPVQRGKGPAAGNI
jgi:endonuclease-8